MLYVQIFKERRALKRQFEHLPRDRRETCWCGGKLLGEIIHGSFQRCETCSGYANTRPLRETELAQIYSLEAYWRQRQQVRSAVPIEQRAALYRSDGRLGIWLKIIEDYGPSHGTAVEIGCAPGVLLRELQSRGFVVKGVEVDPAVSQWITDHMHIEMATGMFPGPPLPPCDVFMAFDVLEHVPRPDEFIRAAAALLNPGGIIVIQTPIDRAGASQPFPHRSDMFDDVEHLFLFTDAGMQRLADRAGLRIIDNQRQLWEAGEICVFKKD